NYIFENNALKISEKLNISLSKTITLIKKILESKFKLKPTTVLKTADVKKIYYKIFNIWGSYFQTNYARNKMKLFYPLPRDYAHYIEKRTDYCIKAKKAVSEINDEEIQWFKSMLSKVGALRKPRAVRRISGRIIVTDKNNIYDELTQKGISNYCDVFLIHKSEIERLKELIESYESVIYITDEAYYPDILDYSDNVEMMDVNTPESEIIPEKILSIYTTNYHTIMSACAIAEKCLKQGLVQINELFFNDVKLSEIEAIKNYLSLIDESGELKQGYDKTLDVYASIIKKLEDSCIEIETELNEYIKDKISKSDVTIKGEQILNILQSSYYDIDREKIKQYLPVEVIEIFDQAVQNAEETLIKKLNLPPEDHILVDGLIPNDIKLPIEIDRKKISDLESKFSFKYNSRKYKLIKNISKKLESYMGLVNKIVKRTMEIDFFMGLGLLSLDYNLNKSNLQLNDAGIGFKNGVNIFLKEEELKGRLHVEPIDYNIGSTPLNSDFSEKTIILTGANSGGKSRCIELIAQIAILAQSGLLVPAELSYCSVFDEIHFFAKSRGMISAGAFEASLKKFAKIASSPGSKLALLDEVEAMTESGAAARILSGFLDIISCDENTCTILVSHLAKEIVKLVNNPIRVDGIEAEGLDEELNLIVNRKPRYNYLARSTPELIVERLYKLSKGKEKKIYELILAEFKGLTEK
ncbi:MAG: MutS-related protein, partial [Candidatus Odinarchaeia archaeon]